MWEKGAGTRGYGESGTQDLSLIGRDNGGTRMKTQLFKPGMRFFKGNTHAHSTASDGRLSPEAVFETYRAAGYDFLALTDHWRVCAARDWRGMLVIPGAEYDFSFPTQVLHLVCLFPDAGNAAGIARGMSHTDVIRHVNGAGGVCIAAHPAWSLNTPEFLKSLDGVEISEVFNTMSDEPFNAPRGNSESLLDVAVANGKFFRLVAADDSHPYAGEQCAAWIMVQAEALSVSAILSALREGRFYATQGPDFRDISVDGDTIAVETSPVSRVTFCSNLYWVEGRCRVGSGLTREVYRVRPGERFVRVQITDADGKRAWSSPIITEHTES